MLIQFIVALFVLRTRVGYDIFYFISDLARELLGFAKAGAAFLTDQNESQSTWFLVAVVPALIFFTSFVQLVSIGGGLALHEYHSDCGPAQALSLENLAMDRCRMSLHSRNTGHLLHCAQKFAIFFFWCMGVSGAEAVVAAASPFIGQQESAILIKPFIAHLTDAEIHQVMCSGFSTIAGSVLVAYIALGVDAEL